MARIRTIKPEFFTSEDIVALSPLARLLFIGTWIEADREGRLAWKLNTLKMRYLPSDNCDVAALAGELVSRGLVVPYGDQLAYLPNFLKHQFINPREAASRLPAPDVSRVSDASLRVNDAPSLPIHSLPDPFPSRSGGALSGSLPRDHMNHAWCGPRFRLCVSYKQMADLEKRWGGDGARMAVEAFLTALEGGLGENDGVGGPVWLLQHFDAHMAATGRLKAAPTAAERKVAAKRNDFEEAKRKLAAKYGETA